MKVIIGTEQILNHHGDLIAVVYHYEDGTKTEKKIFVTASMVQKMHKPLKG